MPESSSRVLFVLLLVSACTDPLLNHLPDIPTANDDTCLGAEAPSNLGATVYADRVELTFASTTDASYQLVLERRREGETFGVLERLLGDARAYTDTSCTAENSFCEYALYGVRRDCQTPISEVLRVYTLPFAATNLAATYELKPTTLDLTLSFIDLNGGSVGYMVARRDGACALTAHEENLLAGVTSWLDPELPYDNEFCYLVAALGPSGMSAEMSLVVGPWPAPPSVLTATACGPGCVELTWGDASTTNTGYRVERSVLPEGPFATISTASLSPTATSYRDESGLDVGSRYYYRVVAEGAYAEGAATVAGDTSALPKLAFEGAPALDEACVLTVAGDAVFDIEHGASYASSEGSFGVLGSEVIASATGLTGELTSFVLGSFEVSWEVTDNFGGVGSLTEDLRLELDPLGTSTYLLLPLGPASPVLGRDGMVGRQVWLGVEPTGGGGGVCEGCGGRRGSLAMGEKTGFVLTAAGEVLGFGDASLGLLGDGTPVGMTGILRTRPVSVCASGSVDGGDCVPLTGALALAARRSHTCVLMATGQVWCFGKNTNGQLGDCSTTPRAVPGPVCSSLTGGSCARLMGVVAVAAGAEHTCVLLNDKTAACFGSEADGRLGNGRDSSSSWKSLPVPVCASGSGDACPRLGGIIALAAGLEHTCALREDSAVLCWGKNSDGQLGDSTAVSKSLPTLVCDPSGCQAPIFGVRAVAAGDLTTCVILNDTTARCWGQQQDGRLGNGLLSAGMVLFPAPVCSSGSGPGCVQANGIIAFGMSSAHTCVLFNDGGAGCFGLGDLGRLGNGTTSTRALPSVVCKAGSGATCEPLGNLLAIGTGANASTCALAEDGGLYCFGENLSGQLGCGAAGGYAETPRRVCTTGTWNGSSCDGELYLDAARRGCGELSVIRP